MSGMSTKKGWRRLSVWIEDNVQKNMSLSGPLIHTLVINMYILITGTGGSSTSDAGMSAVGSSGSSPFQANRAWFDHFKKHYDLCNVKLTGEHASMDQELAETFPAQLTQLIEEKGYLLEQVFNAEETSLFWKKMPTQTFIAKREGTASRFKAAKDQVSILLCANAKDNCMTKPIMLCHSLNPHALNGKNKHYPCFGGPTGRLV